MAIVDMIFQKLKHTLELIKFSHSIFALPFALGSMLVAARGLPDFKTVTLIILAVVCARTAAMSFNRWADAEIDAKNPRTQDRHLPKKILSSRFTLGLCLVSSIGFILVSFGLGNLCMILSPFALSILFLYSYTKRFTHFAQIFLGLSLGIAPIGAWIAITNRMDLAPLLLGLAVLLWVAGFDILYATQDYEFDKKEGLHSLVVKWGIPKAFAFARLMHVLSILLLIFFGIATHLRGVYFAGIFLMGGLFFYEHTRVKPNDLTQINAAFFTANGLISILFLISVGVSV